MSASIWRTDPPPMDGTPIVAVGRIVWSDEDGGGSYPFAALVAWDSEVGQWVHGHGCPATVTTWEDEVAHIDFWLPDPEASSPVDKPVPTRVCSNLDGADAREIERLLGGAGEGGQLCR